MAVRKIDFPQDAERVETGAVQFGDDWPGLFVRGDHACHLGGCIAELLPHLETLLEGGVPVLGEFDWDHLDMALNALSRIRNIIEEEVRVR
jgi:hypothetical protein